MSNAKVVYDQLKRWGQPCVISWPAIGLGANSQAAKQASTYVRISTRVIVNNAGQQTFATFAQIPSIANDGAPHPYSLLGAKIIVGSKTYNVTQATEMRDRGNVYMVKAVLT